MSGSESFINEDKSVIEGDTSLLDLGGNMVQPNVQQQNLDTSLLGLDGGGNMMDGI